MSVETTAQERCPEAGRRLADRFASRMVWKYGHGQIQHGGNLARKPVLGEAMSEVVDLAVYMETIFDQAGLAIDLLNKAVKEHDWVSVIRARNVLTHGNQDGAREEERELGVAWEWSL